MASSKGLVILAGGALAALGVAAMQSKTAEASSAPPWELPPDPIPDNTVVRFLSGTVIVDHWIIQQASGGGYIYNVVYPEGGAATNLTRAQIHAAIANQAGSDETVEIVVPGSTNAGGKFQLLPGPGDDYPGDHIDIFTPGAILNTAGTPLTSPQHIAFKYSIDAVNVDWTGKLWLSYYAAGTWVRYGSFKAISLTANGLAATGTATVTVYDTDPAGAITGQAEIDDASGNQVGATVKSGTLGSVQANTPVLTGTFGIS